MFEKEAQEYTCLNARQYIHNDAIGFCTSQEEVRQAYQNGAELGYNKANKWHYVKDELPRKSDTTLCELIPVFVAVKAGYNVSAYGTYWNLRLGKFECLDEVYAWCYAPEPPELPKEIKEK